MLAPLWNHTCPKNPVLSPLLCDKGALLQPVIGPGEPDFEKARRITPEDVNVEHLLDVFTTITQTLKASGVPVVILCNTIGTRAGRLFWGPNIEPAGGPLWRRGAAVSGGVGLEVRLSYYNKQLDATSQAASQVIDLLSDGSDR